MEKLSWLIVQQSYLTICLKASRGKLHICKVHMRNPDLDGKCKDHTYNNGEGPLSENSPMPTGKCR
jgi:hypothetical protein